MATAKKKAAPRKTTLAPSIRGSAREAQERFRERDAERSRSSTLIQPHEVKGEYDMERMLMTTLGGEIRPLTHEDLNQFRHNAKIAGQRFKGGITPQQVINLSRQEDRDRANQQIHVAVPAGANKGVVRFVTNAGPDSDVSRHNVEVHFKNYEAVIASPGDPKKIAYQLVKKSPVALFCDCGRWRFWFAYLATIGNYAYRYREPAFPKIRNPALSGVACKHILRVMKEVDSNLGIRNLVATMIDKAQRSEGRLHTQITQAHAEEIAKKQAARRKEIKVKIKPKEVAKLKTAVAAKKAPKAKDTDQALSDAQRNLRKLKEQGLLSQADFDTIIKTMNKKG